MQSKQIHVIGIAVVALAIAATGCKRDSASTPDTKPILAATASAAKPASSVVPGSYEDWCEEHQVPESQCTKCNPDLIPAFKAAGDWCNEHNMPESQCTKCDPKRKPVRPPKKS